MKVLVTGGAGRPLFSIVMPIKGVAPYFEEALASVLAQAGEDTEVVVVDGTPDPRRSGALPGRKQGSTRRGAGRYRVVREPDGGQSEALNKGFAQAKGDFFLWVNGDDLLLPGTLEKARAYIEAHPECQWLAGNLKYIDGEGRVVKCAWDGKWRDWLYRNAPVRVYGPTSIFRRELFESVGGFDETLHYLMDTDLWLRFKAAGARFARLPHYCWAFRVHEGSKTSGDLKGKADPRMLAERERVYAKSGLKVTRAGLWRQRLWRAANGSYMRAVMDSVKERWYRGF